MLCFFPLKLIIKILKGDYLPNIRLLDSNPADLTACVTSFSDLNWSTIALMCRAPYDSNKLLCLYSLK